MIRAKAAGGNKRDLKRDGDALYTFGIRYGTTDIDSFTYCLLQPAHAAAREEAYHGQRGRLM